MPPAILSFLPDFLGTDGDAAGGTAELSHHGGGGIGDAAGGAAGICGGGICGGGIGGGGWMLPDSGGYHLPSEASHHPSPLDTSLIRSALGSQV